MKKAALVFVAALACFGCYPEEDIRYDAYLRPDGSVEWLTSQNSVRPYGSDPEERKEAEIRFLINAEQGTHEAALALEALGGYDLQTHILRYEAPYAVFTQARFGSIEEIFGGLLQGIGEVWLERGVMVEQTLCDRMMIRVDLDHEPEEGPFPAERIALNMDKLRIHLVEGRFVDASGFDIDGTEATLSDDEEEEEEPESETITIWLAWTAED